MLTADASYRRGKLVPMKDVLDDALRDAPSVERVVVWRRAGAACTMTPGRDVWWDEAVRDQPGVLEPVPVDSEAPYLLAYTSGTTGRPKGALHVQGGFLLSIARETAYQADVRAGDRVLFSTDMGWIMGPWTVTGGMACGATIVFMEGAPDWPAERVWRLVEEERVTMLGVSPTLVRALIPHGEPAADLSSLRAVVTTGEPWNRRAVRVARRARLRRRPSPDRELLRRDRGRRVLPLGDDAAPDEAVLGRLPRPRRGRRRLRRGRPPGARRSGRARLQAGLARNDPRDLGRPRAVSRDVLAAFSRRVDARRLGLDRRGRVLVSPRPFGRHAEHRR